MKKSVLILFCLAAGSVCLFNQASGSPQLAHPGAAVSLVGTPGVSGLRAQGGVPGPAPVATRVSGAISSSTDSGQTHSHAEAMPLGAVGLSGVRLWVTPGEAPNRPLLGDRAGWVNLNLPQLEGYYYAPSQGLQYASQESRAFQYAPLAVGPLGFAGVSGIRQYENIPYGSYAGFSAPASWAFGQDAELELAAAGYTPTGQYAPLLPLGFTGVPVIRHQEGVSFGANYQPLYYQPLYTQDVPGGAIPQPGATTVYY